MPESKPCQRCGKPAQVRQGRWERTKFCSYQCAGHTNGQKGGASASRLAAARRQVLQQPCDYRLIPLTRNAAALVDIEDYKMASSYHWTFSDSGYARRTVRTENGKKKNERLHRVIMEKMLARPLLASEQVDHINRNRLDNRRENLRLSDVKTNSRNAKRKSRYNFTGVSRNHAKADRFVAELHIDRLKLYIGTFNSPEEAAWMRDQYAIELHGEFAHLNFDYV